MSTDPKVWVAGLLTLFILSFLYKDNPVYRFAEALYIGVSVGYLFVIEYYNVIEPKLIGNLSQGHWWYLFPALLGLFMVLRLSQRFGWLSRYAMAYVIGTFSGLYIINFSKENILNQISHTIMPLIVFNSQGNIDWVVSVNNTIIITGVISALVYFFFSKEHKGFVGGTARVGIYFLMVSFGAAFGYTVMARISLLIGRMSFILGDWMHII